MSRHHNIFIHPRQPVEALVADIGRCCGVSLAPVEHEVINFAVSIGHAAIELELAHEYENEPDLPFEDYDALFMIRDFDSNLDREEATARQIFRRLSALNKYSLMLVLDLDVLLDSFTPTHEGGPPRSY